jgi:hypothetical protein
VPQASLVLQRRKLFKESCTTRLCCELIKVSFRSIIIDVYATLLSAKEWFKRFLMQSTFRPVCTEPANFNQRSLLFVSLTCGVAYSAFCLALDSCPSKSICTGQSQHHSTCIETRVVKGYCMRCGKLSLKPQLLSELIETPYSNLHKLRDFDDAESSIPEDKSL